MSVRMNELRFRPLADVANMTGSTVVFREIGGQPEFVVVCGECEEVRIIGLREGMQAALRQFLGWHQEERHGAGTEAASARTTSAKSGERTAPANASHPAEALGENAPSGVAHEKCGDCDDTGFVEGPWGGSGEPSPCPVGCAPSSATCERCGGWGVEPCPVCDANAGMAHIAAKHVRDNERSPMGHVYSRGLPDNCSVCHGSGQQPTVTPTENP